MRTEVSEASGLYLDGEVLVHQEVRALEIAMHDWRHTAVEIVHAPGNVDSYPHPPFFIQNHVWRPAVQCLSAPALADYAAELVFLGNRSLILLVP